MKYKSKIQIFLIASQQQIKLFTILILTVNKYGFYILTSYISFVKIVLVHIFDIYTTSFKI